MAGIDVGGQGRRRSVDHEIPLIPFIDFLLCLVSFLLMTAVWTQMSRIDADARAPGPAQGDENPQRELTLHVEMRGEEKFALVWKEGSKVRNTIDVPRKAVPLSGDDFNYPELAQKISEQWNSQGSHRANSDLKLDQAVLHTDNTTKFADIIAVMDAIHSPRRQIKLGGAEQTIPAFNVTFAAD